MKWSLPSSNNESVLFGTVDGPFGPRPYNIPLEERDTHLYCIGKTKRGKSKFLENLIVSDIMAGRGCCLVDPHADLARDVLSHLATIGFFNNPAAFERVIYVAYS